MKKTTVMLDEELLKRAMQAVKARTKREAIVAGLEALIRDRNRNALREELGSYDLDLTLEELEGLRNDE